MFELLTLTIRKIGIQQWNYLLYITALFQKEILRRITVVLSYNYCNFYLILNGARITYVNYLLKERLMSIDMM